MMDIDGPFGYFGAGYWRARGVRIMAHTGCHRRFTHADRRSPAMHAKRKTRRKMARASRRRNR